MKKNKKGSNNVNLTCHICQIDCATNADYALHEFSKKHCDNLLKISRKKPLITKKKNKPDVEQTEKKIPKPNIITQAGSFAKYGYFVPSDVYKTQEPPREFNLEYDPYLQKFAENPFKEKVSYPPVPGSNDCKVSNNNLLSFNRKKRKKVKTCQICNLTFMTVPEYDLHVKSPQHIWKLKITGMGVSAHFVKASTDLHTTDIDVDQKLNQSSEENCTSKTIFVNENSSYEGSFPSLFCDVCKLLLNSCQQYNMHVTGRTHLECAQRKAELKARKEKLQSPSPNQLYCYSCKISLNNLIQYNEHKNGKKHKIKCRQLRKEGITIPPEERLPEWTTPKMDFNIPIIYPELYEKFVLEKQNEKNIEENNLSYIAPGKKNPVYNRGHEQMQNNTLISDSLSNMPEYVQVEANGPRLSDQLIKNSSNVSVNIIGNEGVSFECNNANALTTKLTLPFEELLTDGSEKFVTSSHQIENNNLSTSNNEISFKAENEQFNTDSVGQNLAKELLNTFKHDNQVHKLKNSSSSKNLGLETSCVERK